MASLPGKPQMTATGPRWDGLLLDCRLATMAGEPGSYGIVEDAALAWKDGLICFAGPRLDLPGEPDSVASDVHSAAGDWITPALVDCHTHLVFAGNRAGEPPGERSTAVGVIHVKLPGAVGRIGEY